VFDTKGVQARARARVKRQVIAGRVKPAEESRLTKSSVIYLILNTRDAGGADEEKKRGKILRVNVFSSEQESAGLPLTVGVKKRKHCKIMFVRF